MADESSKILKDHLYWRKYFSGWSPLPELGPAYSVGTASTQASPSLVIYRHFSWQSRMLKDSTRGLLRRTEREDV